MGSFPSSLFSSDPRIAALEAELKAETLRADTEARRADLATDRAEDNSKTIFVTKFRSIGFHDSRATISNAAETSGSAPPPITVDLLEVLGESCPAPSEAATLVHWEKFCANFLRAWKQPAKEKIGEDRDVHPVIYHMLLVLLEGRDLRVWWNKETREAKSQKAVRPDFTITHSRDSFPTLIGSALSVEVKNPEMVSHKSSQLAGVQSRGYLRRRLLQVFEEGDLRGDPLHTINGFTVGTDGLTITVARMFSGAPAPGVTFEGCEPCPVRETGPLELLKGWDFYSAPNFSISPPPGFKALAHLCSLSSSILLGPSILPLTRLRVWVQHGDEGAPTAAHAAGGSEWLSLALGSRLGCGGSSDTYECWVELGEEGGLGVKAPMVIKTPRTGSVGACYTRERVALHELQTSSSAASSGLVPTLRYWGTRSTVLGWPVLLMTPAGVPIDAWVQGKVGIRRLLEGGGAAAAAASVRRQCATDVCLRLLTALQHAHGMGLIHCDVRPENVIMAGGGRVEGWADAQDDAGETQQWQAVLVDWGISRHYQDAAKGLGVATYASSAVFLQTSYDARPLQDLVAVIYTWLTIAFSPQCKAPWGVMDMDDLASSFAAREKWIRSKCLLALTHINTLQNARVTQEKLHQMAEDAVGELSQLEGAL